MRPFPLRAPAFVPALSLAIALAILAIPAALRAQPTDSLARLVVEVRHQGAPLAGVVVRAGAIGRQTDAAGRAELWLPPGAHEVIAARLGFAPDTARVTLAPRGDTLVTLELREQSAELEAVVVSATRSEKRIEDVPLRVEIVEPEEVDEKTTMTPSDVAMLLNETSGLRVQTTSAGIGGASVRVQGLRGRYTLLLSDGLPLHGGQSGGLSVLQIPPADLARVEVIKGTASALYGASALGGVVNFVSKQPVDSASRVLLLNATSRGGSDAVLFASAPLDERFGYTTLVGLHAQARQDIDGDGWTDLAGYRRGVARPRLFWRPDEATQAFLTGGWTSETREGGIVPGDPRLADRARPEGLETGRGDVGGVVRRLIGRSILSARASFTGQRHEHEFAARPERDRHDTGFAELAYSAAVGPATLVGGAAYQREAYRNRDYRRVEYTHLTRSAFAQADLDAVSWLALSVSARRDRHSEYGVFLNPRVSALLRAPAGAGGPAFLSRWTARLSSGRGNFAPTPFVDETEATGLSRVLFDASALRAERARSLSFDLNGYLPAGDDGRLELNATVFGSRIRYAVMAVPVPDPSDEDATPWLELRNATAPTHSGGAELLARLVREPFIATASYAYLRAREEDPVGGGRRAVPLTPRHALGFDLNVELEPGRLGLEVFYVGRQSLDDNPYRSESRPYAIVGVLAERRIGRAKLFINAENLGDVRQTRYDPLVLPEVAAGGRVTTDVWSTLEGRVVNGGMRLSF